MGRLHGPQRSDNTGLIEEVGQREGELSISPSERHLEYVSTPDDFRRSTRLDACHSCH